MELLLRVAKEPEDPNAGRHPASLLRSAATDMPTLMQVKQAKTPAKTLASMSDPRRLITSTRKARSELESCNSEIGAPLGDKFFATTGADTSGRSTGQNQYWQ